MIGPNYGDAFLLSVWESNINRALETSDVDVVTGIEHERSLAESMQAEVQEYGGAQQAYLCIPIGRVWTDDPGDENDATNAPNRVVRGEWAETELERMGRAAVAMGVCDERERSTNT